MHVTMTEVTNHEYSLAIATLDLALDLWHTQNLFTGVLIAGRESDDKPFVVWAMRVRWTPDQIGKPGGPDRQPYEMAMHRLRNDARGSYNEGSQTGVTYRISPPKHTFPEVVADRETHAGLEYMRYLLESTIYCRMVEVPYAAPVFDG